ncbi:glycosyl transferase [Acinetobacter indicus]|uniref:glycosyltransferase family 4 protein n=1 Tax=Acinetobacter indicus TaxID=756892 RepID=UPI0005F81681|nr:glycosyltransferase family 1 protein [Acinetobacter indicus]KJV44180.1 glycosyl transferase [Acinetobacter indicus]OUY10097.1 glycosyl transferase [Acinetobacter indicus]
MSASSRTLVLKSPNIPENFKFYFKQEKQKNAINEVIEIEELVRPRLRIALVTETWPPEINGVANSLLQLCKGLQKLGHKILLIRPEQKQPCTDFSPNKECLVKAQSIPKYGHLQFGWPQLYKLSTAMDEFEPDIVHVVTEGPLGLAALQVAKSKQIPVSSGFHSAFQDFSRFFDLAFLVKPIQRYLCWFHNNTQLTCVPSTDTEQSLRQFGVEGPLVVVGRGVDVDRFSPQHRSEALRSRWGADEQTRVLLYVGRVSPEKEVNVVIDAYRAMQSIAKCPTKLVVVGDGPDLKHLEGLNTDGEVIFMGSLSGQKLAEAYASADVFVFASQVETFGNVVLEAMASGLPVVAYDYACANLHVKQDETGWLSPLGDVAGIMRSIYQLPSAKVLRQMGKKARESTQHIGWQYPIQQFEQALYRVVQESHMTT